MRAVALSLLMIAMLGLASVAHADVSGVRALVAKKAAILGLLHGKAANALLVAAQAPGIGEFVSAPDGEARHRLKEHVDQISLSTQRHFHVEEMCLITSDGVELSRIVGQEIANDLSTEEVQAIFFEPGFALPPGEVHVSPVYLSPDTGELVVAYVTPIQIDGKNRAIFHYEHLLATYWNSLIGAGEAASMRILAVDRQGRVAIDSDVSAGWEAARWAAEPPRLELGGLTLAELQSRLGGGDAGAGVLVIDGGMAAIAYRSVEDWTLIAIERL